MIRKKGEEISKPLSLREHLDSIIDRKDEQIIILTNSLRFRTEQLSTLNRHCDTLAAENKWLLDVLETDKTGLARVIERARKSVPADYLRRTAKTVNEWRGLSLKIRQRFKRYWTHC